MLKILSVFGTRPEAIKMAPVLSAIASMPETFDSRVCVTAQHRGMLDQTLQLFGIAPDYDLDVMTPNQTPSQVAAAVLLKLEPILNSEDFDWLLVQGDTTSTAVAALAAFHARVKVAHVEAGLRTYDLEQPFPEELNRRVVSLIAELHFAATVDAQQNLIREGIDPTRIVVTGNPVIDALRQMLRLPMPAQIKPMLDGVSGNGTSAKPKLILVTAHRRENFGQPLANICAALKTIAREKEVHIVFAVHENPNVRGPVREVLGDVHRITLTAPLDYLSLVHLANAAHIIVTDSGGLQEEAPSLGKPVLVMRKVTERKEAIAGGMARIVGTETETIVQQISRLLGDEHAYHSMSKRTDLYGDGKASERIARALAGTDPKLVEPRGIEPLTS